MDDVIEKLAGFLHSNWKDEMENEGYHLPEQCPNFEDDYDEEKETADKYLIHCRKCNVHMCSFDKLEEYQKHKFHDRAQTMFAEIEKFGLKIVKI